MGGTGSQARRSVHHMLHSKRCTGRKSPISPTRAAARRPPNWSANTSDSNVNNPSENIAQWRAGQVRALCVFSEQRMDYKEKMTDDQSWSDIPTCKEQGIDVQYQMLRAFFLPPGTTEEQAAYYVDLLKKVVATPEWKEYMERKALKQTFLTGDGLRQVPGERRRISPRADERSGVRREVAASHGIPGARADSRRRVARAGHGAGIMEKTAVPDPASGGVTERAVGAVHGDLIFLVGVVMMAGQLQLGAGWAQTGREAGYFPFRIGAIICIASSRRLLRTFSARPAARDSSSPGTRCGRCCGADTHGRSMCWRSNSSASMSPPPCSSARSCGSMDKFGWLKVLVSQRRRKS